MLAGSLPDWLGTFVSVGFYATACCLCVCLLYMCENRAVYYRHSHVAWWAEPVSLWRAQL